MEAEAAAAEKHLGKDITTWRWIPRREGGRPQGADLSPLALHGKVRGKPAMDERSSETWSTIHGSMNLAML